jgi:hypothetical protein
MEKKYHLVSWNVVCKSKSQGGLRVLDLKIMNTVLLAKWMVRFQDPKVQGQWKTVIQAKYSISIVNIFFFGKIFVRTKI